GPRGDHGEPHRREDVDVVALRIGIVRAPRRTGANGEPVATSARPSDQRTRSSAVASDLAVGLESGKTIGRSTLRAISRTTGSVKAPPTVDRPMRIVASVLPITSAR